MGDRLPSHPRESVDVMIRIRRAKSLALYAVLFVVFLYGPVLLVPLFSFNDSIHMMFPLEGFTTRWYADVIYNTSLIRALWNSASVGALAAIVSTAFGLMAAKALTRYRLPGKGLATSVILLPLVVPTICLGIGLLLVVQLALGLPLSLWTIGAGHVLICLPVTILVLMSRLESFDKSLEEASLDLGESAWSTFWRVTFPLAWPGIVSSLLLAFTISLDEFVIAYFLSGTDVTLPIYIWGQLRFPAKLPSVLAVGSLILVVSCLFVVFSILIRQRGIVSMKRAEG